MINMSRGPDGNENPKRYRAKRTTPPPNRSPVAYCARRLLAVKTDPHSFGQGVLRDTKASTAPTAKNSIFAPPHLPGPWSRGLSHQLETYNPTGALQRALSRNCAPDSGAPPSIGDKASEAV